MIEVPAKRASVGARASAGARAAITSFPFLSRRMRRSEVADISPGSYDAETRDRRMTAQDPQSPVIPELAEHPCPNCGQPMLAAWGATCGRCKPKLAYPKT